MIYTGWSKHGCVEKRFPSNPLSSLRETGNSDHLEMAQYFDMGSLLGPLAINKDPLTGLHANQHMPIVLGGAARYEVVQDEIFKNVSPSPHLDLVH